MIRGLAIPFHSLSEPLGGGAFRERFDPSAIRRTLDEKIDVRALVGHDPIKVLGRVSSKTLALHVDNLGLHFSVDPPNTSYARDLIALVSRGDVVNASFGFQTIEDTWTMTAGTPLRTVVDARIFEISIVTWGSYTATAVMVS